MILRRLAVVSIPALAVLAQACGSSVEPQGPSTPAPTATTNPPPADPSQGNPTPSDTPPAPPPPDHGAPSSTFPAFKPDVGQLVNNGGTVLKSPKIVTITWPNESNADAFEKFGDDVGQSAYWKDVVGEYGVGAASSGATSHVRITDAAPTSISDSGLQQLLSDHISAAKIATTKWPAPTDQSIYIMYLPMGTSLDMGGGQDACSSGVGGYHDSVAIDGAQVAYAVIPQCSGGSPLDDSTASASHELAEAATDPHPNDSPGWVGFDDNHLAWEYFQQFQSEDGDACEFYRDSFFRSTATDLTGYAVQRMWSNASAAAGHNPCVPAASGSTYFNVTPLETESISVDLSAFQGSANQQTMGYHVAVGDTRTIKLGFYSDGATDAWTITAVDGSPFTRGQSTSKKTELTLDKTSGQNGEKALLTVKVDTAGKTKGELVTIVSQLGSTKHYMPIMIGSM